jgi:hypothetical protein
MTNEEENQRIANELFFSELERRFYLFTKECLPEDWMDWGDPDCIAQARTAFFKDLAKRYKFWTVCRAEHYHAL